VPRPTEATSPSKVNASTRFLSIQDCLNASHKKGLLDALALKDSELMVENMVQLSRSLTEAEIGCVISNYKHFSSAEVALVCGLLTHPKSSVPVVKYKQIGKDAFNSQDTSARMSGLTLLRKVDENWRVYGRIALKDSSPYLRAYAVYQYGAEANKADFDTVKSLSNDPSEKVRVEVVHALFQIDQVNCRPVLRRMTLDSSLEVKNAAKYYLH
jgi:hypothetical protein